MKKLLYLFFIFLLLLVGCENGQTSNTATSYDEVGNVSGSEIISVVVTGKINDTNQDYCSSDVDYADCPDEGRPYYGQDAQYTANQMNFSDNRDGTITDENTGLVWTKQYFGKYDYSNAPSTTDVAGYGDWRLPTIKEMYSLIDFRGVDPSSMDASADNLIPFINEGIFDFAYGDTSNGDRIIDSQWVTTSIYSSTIMNGQECFFGVNFVDGRIKCYPTISGGNNGYYVRYVRGESYGENQFVDNLDGTVTDTNSVLVWQQSDSGEGMNWEEALAYCENLDLAGNSDWRLPNAKELQSIVDYSRSPDATDSAAIDPVFSVSQIINEAGQTDYPYFWTSTTHANQRGVESAAYIAFGRAMGYMSQFGGWVDVHGAGAQRSDPKSGNADDYPQGRGPQGDAIRIDNYVRCVRG